MKHLRIVSVIMFFFICLNSNTSESGAKVALRIGPPTPRQEVIARKPHRHSVWVSGHWKWNSSTKSFGWVNGKWVKGRGGHLWVPAHWVKTNDGWVFVEGHWKRI